MKLRSPLTFLALAALTTLTACDEDQTTIGGSVMPVEDHASTDQYNFNISTRSVKTGAVIANASSGYLGSVLDPETGILTTSDYMVQFHLPENYVLPAKSLMLTDTHGNITVDSCILRIHHDKYFGDSLATMKVMVQELDTARTLLETSTYYTDIRPEDFVGTTSTAKKNVAYTALDQTKAADKLNDKNLYRGISVHLENDFGKSILEKYYQNPNFFKNSYEFTKHVCAGFYLKHAGGVGAMINSELTTLNIYFRQHSTTQTGNDSIVQNILRVAATSEVIQNTRITSEIPNELLAAEQPFTHIKSPAGIHVEATLPVNEVLSDTHYNDTINSARFNLRVFKKSEDSKYNLPLPQTLLMLPLAKLHSFFAENKLPDNVYSYLSTYNTAGYYPFTNIAPLISALRRQRDLGAGVQIGDSESTRKAKWAQWEVQNPDWNKVAIIAVAGDYNVSQNSYGTTTKTLLRLHHDYGLSSVKLEGGANNPIELSVIYSRFKQ